MVYEILVCCAFTIVKDLPIFNWGLFIECKSESVRDNIPGKILDDAVYKIAQS